MSSWSCKCNKGSTLQERQYALQLMYTGVRKPNCQSSLPFSCNGVRAPYQISTGSGYGNPLPMSGTDNWGPTMAQSTMDNLYGSGLSDGITGISTREGNCTGCVDGGCPTECATPVASWTNPDTLVPYSGQAAIQAYKKYHFKKFGDSGDARGVRNTSGDSSFYNPDLLFWKWR
tara:strand:- start:1409 stop:1930 length:522 start_codon:yes stop_codon:yes gene_type:complete